MAKKLSPKELREQNKQKQREKWAAAKPIAKEPAETTPAEEKKPVIRKCGKKTRAKALGLKSVFVTGEKVQLTSFGRGNKAELEKTLAGDTVIHEVAPGQYSLAVQEHSYTLSGRNKLQGSTDKPKAVREDALHAKAALEKLFFCEEKDDNIHIQLIYNILDIEKILAVHSANIAYTINNLRRKQEDETDDEWDLLGTLSLKTSFTQFITSNNPVEAQRRMDFYRLLYSFDDGVDPHERYNKKFGINPYLRAQSRLGYFGNAFLRVDQNHINDYLKSESQLEAESYRKKTDKKPEYVLRREDEIYAILRMLSGLRQFVTHEDMADWLYTLDKLPEDCRSLLDQLFNDRVDKLNCDFLKMSKKDLEILFDALGSESDKDKERITRNYYRHIVLKDSRNLGFSVRKLREYMADFPEANELRNEKYNTMRSKLYHLVDFVVFNSYTGKDGGKAGKDFVEKLRTGMTPLEKEQSYQLEAQRLWQKLKPVVLGRILPKMDGKVIKNLKGVTLDESVLDSVKISTEASYFTKLMYLLTYFLDGKEINDLLTTLINKFENIQSFLDVLTSLGMNSQFNRETGSCFEMFKDSEKIAKELRAVKSFARMQTELPAIKESMLIDAARLLGAGEGEESFKRILTAYFGEEYTQYRLANRMNEWVKPEDFYSGLRNFIASNVVESSRFRYLVRYNNVNRVRALAQNEAVVRYVLSRMPETQISRYYKTIGRNPDMCSVKRQLEDLVGYITKMNFFDFKDVAQNDLKSSYEQKQDKQHKQGLISLYLTVLYILTKNLVNINSRYVIALHRLSLDTKLHQLSVDAVKQMPDDANKTFNMRWGNANALTQKFLENEWLNAHACKYIRQNLEHYSTETFRTYRNTVAHLNAVTEADRYMKDVKAVTSYFSLYHYLVQRHLSATLQSEKIAGHLEKEEAATPAAYEKLMGYLESVETYGSYCKDWLWALNTPFAYNLPRYKNLSVEALFDRNEQPETTEAGMAAAK